MTASTNELHNEVVDAPGILATYLPMLMGS